MRIAGRGTVWRRVIPRRPATSDEPDGPTAPATRTPWAVTTPRAGKGGLAGGIKTEIRATYGKRPEI